METIYIWGWGFAVKQWRRCLWFHSPTSTSCILPSYIPYNDGRRGGGAFPASSYPQWRFHRLVKHKEVIEIAGQEADMAQEACIMWVQGLNNGLSFLALTIYKRDSSP